MPELQGPVRKSKQFGGRSEAESPTRSERQVWMRVGRFHLPDGKEVSLMARSGPPVPDPQGLIPGKAEFFGVRQE